MVDADPGHVSTVSDLELMPSTSSLARKRAGILQVHMHVHTHAHTCAHTHAHIRTYARMRMYIHNSSLCSEVGQDRDSDFKSA